MTAVLVQFMWLEALAYPLDLLIAAVVGAVAWHWIEKGWQTFMRWVWRGKPE